MTFDFPMPGRLLYVGFKGLLPEDEPALARLAQEGLIGGMLLLGRNCVSHAQLSELCQAIHELPSPFPLHICLDQEGGRVLRLPWLGTPSARDVAAGMPAEEAEQLYYETACELKTCGVDWNLAPVVDLDLEPLSPAIGLFGRSYSEDARAVSSYAAACIRAHHRAGAPTCLKHFPGHGSASVDTHEGLADITVSWRKLELTPYRELLRRNLVDSVMVGHLLQRKVDPLWPASLSAVHMRLLREELGWNGLVVADDMQMGALHPLGAVETLMLRALSVGVDLFLTGNWLVYDLDLPQRWHKMMIEKLKRDEMIRARLQEATSRQQRLFA